MRLLRKKLKKLKRIEFLFPLLVFLLAFLLRIYLLNENLFFGWEQGRDAWIIKDIIELKKFTLIGAKTDLEGIFHGPFYYYMMAIPYFIGRGNPVIAALFIALLNAVGASFIFFVGKKDLSLFARMATALIYSLSFQGIVFSRWLSNPSLVLPLSVILFLLLTIKFKERHLLSLVLLWGIIFHLELASALFLLPVLFYYLIINLKKIRFSHFVKSGLILLLIFSPYLIFDFRHEHILSKGLLSFFKPPEPNQARLGTVLKELYKVGLREYTRLVIPQFPQIAKIFFWLTPLIAFFERRKKIAQISLLWLFSPLFFLIPLRASPMSQTLIHLGPAFFVLFGLMIEKTIKITKNYYLGAIVLIFVLLANFDYYQNALPENKNFFFRAYQYTFIGPQEEIIDFIYQKARGDDFYFNYYTFPYWLPQGWNYLFEYYGKGKYGYLPSSEKKENYFIIIEPDEVTPKYQEDWYKKINEESKLLESFSSGKLKVEKRLVF